MYMYTVNVVLLTFEIFLNHQPMYSILYIEPVSTSTILLLLLYRTERAESSQPAMKIRKNEDVNKMCKIKDVNLRMNVMYNMCTCYYCVLSWNSYCTLPRKTWREKTLGEMWAAVIRTINNLLRTAWLWTGLPEMGTEPESVDAQKGTMKDVFARCLKKKKAPVYIAQMCALS
jgi:hypothetical protein